jgi:hypothetical protein
MSDIAIVGNESFGARLLSVSGITIDSCAWSQNGDGTQADKLAVSSDTPQNAITGSDGVVAGLGDSGFTPIDPPRQLDNLPSAPADL